MEAATPHAFVIDARAAASRLRRSRWGRAARLGRQWLRVLGQGHRPRTRFVFVFGLQRSGTRVPIDLLRQVPGIEAYGESGPFFRGVLLRSDRTLVRLARRSPYETIVLKPICESHRAARLLAAFPGSKVVWVFRGFRDSVRSAAKKFPGIHRGLSSLAGGDLAGAGWRAGGLSPDRLRTLASHYRDDLSCEAAHALFYWARNSLFFDLGLDSRRDVHLLEYEDVVTAPERSVPPLFQFLGHPFEARGLRGLYRSSVGAAPAPALPDDIEQLCRQVHRRLVECYRRQQSQFATGARPEPRALRDPAAGGAGSDRPQAMSATDIVVR